MLLDKIRIRIDIACALSLVHRSNDRQRVCGVLYVGHRGLCALQYSEVYKKCPAVVSNFFFFKVYNATNWNLPSIHPLSDHLLGLRAKLGS